MNFTFGIISSPMSGDYISDIIDSIEAQKIPKYEVVLVGGLSYQRRNVHWIPFDEKMKPGWITKKKNCITEHAQYENVVYMHDYVVLTHDWYKGFLQFGDGFDVCMNKIINRDGSRFRDWCAWDDPAYGSKWVCNEVWCNGGMEFEGNMTLVPYDYTRTEKMYVSGTYWVAKQSFMERFPLNEELVWGQGEDVEWSLRWRDKSRYLMNLNSEVRLLKQK